MTGDHVVICKLKSYIQPFERSLALREIEAISKNPPILVEGDSNSVLFATHTNVVASTFIDRLTYWELVWAGGLNGHAGEVTTQAKREATWGLAKNGEAPRHVIASLSQRRDVSLPRRRVLRYGPHGLHEYRGKFFPQLARSILNIVQSEEGWLVLDPMCGSGTTLVEAVLLGCNAVGIDMNPLSVMVSQAKVDILKERKGTVVSEYERLREGLEKRRGRGNGRLNWFSSLSDGDQGYLRRWFSQEVLASLDPIAVAVRGVQRARYRLFFTSILSNILRRVSWQKVDDLRVRKAKGQEEGVDVLGLFLDEARRSVSAVSGMLAAASSAHIGRGRVIHGDVRDIKGLLSSRRYPGADVVITSPPYATALPYIDTDRLSLSYLGLMPRLNHRNAERRMIGNREVSQRQREDMFTAFVAAQGQIPGTVSSLVNRIHILNEGASVGFRRRNSAALIGSYFLEMRKVLIGIRDALRPGGRAFVVVGSNYTIAGGERVDINTDKLLAEIGESAGLIVEGLMAMQMLNSRDIFRNNSGSVETLIEFRRA